MSAPRMISQDGHVRVTAKQLGTRAVLHVESLGGLAAGRPAWLHVDYCDTPEQVALHVPLQTLRPECKGEVATP